MGYFDVEQPREPNLGRNAGVGLAVLALLLAACIALAWAAIT